MGVAFADADFEFDFLFCFWAWLRRQLQWLWLGQMPGQKGVTFVLVTVASFPPSVFPHSSSILTVFDLPHVGLIYFDFWPFSLRFIWSKLCTATTATTTETTATFRSRPLTRGFNVPNDCVRSASIPARVAVSVAVSAAWVGSLNSILAKRTRHARQIELSPPKKPSLQSPLLSTCLSLSSLESWLRSMRLIMA